MGWFLVPVVVILLLVVPYFAADSRDGADWKPVALRRPARGTRRTLSFSESPGALAVRKVVSRAFASHNPMRRMRKTGQTRPVAKIGAGLADRVAVADRVAER
jgi:hypothetical protein